MPNHDRSQLSFVGYYNVRLTLLTGLMGIATTLAAWGYVSPFTLALDESIESWTSDFDDRAAAINTYSYPSPANWYSHDYGSFSYGPLIIPSFIQLPRLRTRQQ